MPSGEGYDLYGLRLSDKLNLTGRVKRRGVHAATSGGCANVWEGEFEGEKVAVKVIREIGTRASKERLQKVRLLLLKRLCSHVVAEACTGSSCMVEAASPKCSQSIGLHVWL